MAPFAQLTAGAKALAGLVAVIGVGSLIYGGYQLREQILSPSRAIAPFDTQLAQIIPKTEEEELEALKQKDTDGDTLSDYDEIHIYNTSPYIVDTDSDGIADNVEIAAGSDPNCAPGEDCLGIRLVTPETKISDLFPQFSGSDITLKDKTIKEFRQILLDQGYDAEKLAQVDDATLLIILEESLKIQDQEAGGTNEPGAIDLDEVRQFLIDLGVPEDEVYSLSNDELEDILRTFE